MMKSQVISTRSGTYWQEMIKMNEGELQTAFNECAQRDMVWAIDQARLVSLWSEPGSTNDKIARGFCLAAAETLMEESPKDAVEALQVAANDSQNPEMALEAARSLKVTLEKMAMDHHEAALGSAILLRARSQKNAPALSAVTEFMIEQDDAETGFYLRSIIRDADDLKAEHRQKLIRHIVNLAAMAPYKAYVMSDEMLGVCTRLESSEMATLHGLREELSERADVIKEILRNDYGEDPEKAASERKLMMMPALNNKLH